MVMKSKFSTSSSKPAARGMAAIVLASQIAFALVLQGANDGYVAHEWGTFTSIQGGDGVLLNWNGIETSDLPPFVYDWSRPGLERSSPLVFSKSSGYSLQRMETPVIYFYSNKPLRVDVAVEFPLGRITEWFPQAAEIGPSSRPPNRLLTALDNTANRVGLHPNPDLVTLFGEPPVTNSIIRWKDVAILPAEEHAKLARELPTAAERSHYFAARTEDAAFVRVNSIEPTNPAPEIEKFLFYRGVGNFQTPLEVTINESDQITLSNTGDAPLNQLFAMAIKGEHAMVMPLGQLDAGQTRDLRLDTVNASRPAGEALKDISRQMADALVAEGLYRTEAEAMVNTWRDAWFEDQGVRILYLLPRTWTDSVLPITLNPQPRELVRVMVGRAELITPGMEAQIRQCVEGFRQSDPAVKQAALRDFHAMKLGRFAPVGIRLAASRVKDANFYDDGVTLIEAAAKQETTGTNVSPPARRLAVRGR